MPIGRLIRKIQCQRGDVDQPAAQDRAEDRAEQHRDAEHRHHPADPLRAGRAGHDRHAQRHQHPAAEPLEHPERDQHLDAVGGGAEHRAGGEQRQREHVEPLGAEPVGRPAGQRDHRGEGQRVAGHRPGDLRRRGVEDLLEGGQRDADDGDVEDRHDRAEHHDAGDEQDVLVELVGGRSGRHRGRLGRGLGGHRTRLDKCGLQGHLIRVRTAPTRSPQSPAGRRGPPGG